MFNDIFPEPFRKQWFQAKDKDKEVPWKRVFSNNLNRQTVSSLNL